MFLNCLKKILCWAHAILCWAPDPSHHLGSFPWCFWIVLSTDCLSSYRRATQQHQHIYQQLLRSKRKVRYHEQQQFTIIHIKQLGSPESLNSYITWKAKSKFFSTRVSTISHLLLKARASMTYQLKIFLWTSDLLEIGTSSRRTAGKKLLFSQLDNKGNISVYPIR